MTEEWSVFSIFWADGSDEVRIGQVQEMKDVEGWIQETKGPGIKVITKTPDLIVVRSNWWMHFFVRKER